MTDKYHYLVDEDIERRAAVLLDEASGIPVLPFVLVLSQISGEGFYSPRAVNGIADGSERRHTAVYTGILQGAH